MASPICDFIFGSLHTCLLTDTVDVELTIRMVKGIYTYHKDHTAESTVFSLWSKSMIPFPSLRCKIQAFQDDNSKQMIAQNSHMTLQFPAPPKPHQSPRKCTPGKTRTRWSNCNHWFNPIRTNRYNTLKTEPNDMDKIDTVQPTPKRACVCSDGLCNYCKYEAPHPSQEPSDWSSEEWDGEKAKAREQKPLIDFMPPKQGTDLQMMEVMADDISFQKLTLQSDDPHKNSLEVMDTLIPLLEASTETPVAEASATDTAKSDDSTKTHYKMLSEQELRTQREEEKYAIYISMLSEEEKSNTETDTNKNAYSYFK